jgi:Bacterial protein of unknown function (DUF885)
MRSVLISVILATLPVAAGAATDSRAETPAELLELAREFRSWRRETSGLPDIGQRVASLKRGLAERRRKLEALQRDGWPVTTKVDYLVVRSEMDRLLFDLEVIRESTRNPAFYLDEAIQGVTRQMGRRYQTGPGVTVPYDAERANAILAGLRATPEIVAQGPKLLTEAVREMADMTIERLEGVGEGYRELARIVAPHLPDPLRGQLAPAAEAAGKALEGFREWLRDNRDGMQPYRPIGRKAFEWYTQRVLFFPYDSDQLLTMAELERDRGWAFLEMERRKNRHLPEIGPAGTNREYSEWKDATDVLSRLWAEEYDLFTRPDFVGPMRDEDGGVWIEPFGLFGFPTQARPVGSKTEFLVPPDHWFAKIYWELGHRLDPGTNHPHSDYPGHTFEGMVSRRNTSEIRRGHNTRGDSWTYYMEEVQLQMDYPFVRGHRVREWMYGLHIMRAERVYVAVKFADGSKKPEEIPEHMLAFVPWMEPYVARKHELWRKFTDPAQVLTYQVGRTEIYKLLGERKRQLGDEFDLGRFHDELLATGQIPVALARWEMTGNGDRVAALWKASGPPPVENAAPRRR